MFDVILCTDKNGGIGLNARMAWQCPEELQRFKELTMGSLLIMGRKTVQYLPKLEGRTILCITKDLKLNTVKYANRVHLFDSVNSALEFAQQKYPNKNLFVAGGGGIYKEVFTNHLPKIKYVHLSVMKKEFHCDTHVSIPPAFLIEDSEEFADFFYYRMRRGESQEAQYTSLLSSVLKSGRSRSSRNSVVRSSFVKHLQFDLRTEFPLLTTKKMFWRGVVEELLFFLRGETNSKLLEEKGVNIWKGNTSREFLDAHGFKDRPEGEMGPMYGYQWRRFGGDDNCDQLANLLHHLRTDPNSRRLLMTDYNPAQASQGVLYPCHSIVNQFYVDGDFLDMFCYNRSSDLFLGLPFNIASSSLLLCIIAKACQLTPRYFNLTLGDSHIYNAHISACEEQIGRTPYVLPTLTITPDLYSISDLEELKYEDFVLEEYKSHPAIKAEMIP
jgi:thymidylate synthase